MKKLTDVYIKVNKRNHQWLSELFDSSSLELNTYIDFYAEDYRCKFYYSSAPKNKQKVSLSQLKRLIDTIPTREEITRLKRQISAYKTNYDKAVKYSLSKEDVIEDLQRKLNRERSKTADLFKQRKEVQLNHCKQIRTLAQEVERVKTLYDDALKLNDDILEISEYFREQYRLERLKNKKWWQIWK